MNESSTAATYFSMFFDPDNITVRKSCSQQNLTKILHHPPNIASWKTERHFFYFVPFVHRPDIFREEKLKMR